MPESITKTVLAVSGMRSNSCRERVIEALQGVAGVADVSVSLIRARAIIRHSPACETDALVQAVAAAGYLASPT